MDDIKVKIVGGAGIKTEIKPDPKIKVRVGGGGGSDIPPYIGAYTVEPDPYDDIILPTAGKKMLNNVKTLKIPSREVKNISGGSTFIVGGIEYGNQ